MKNSFEIHNIMYIKKTTPKKIKNYKHKINDKQPLPSVKRHQVYQTRLCAPVPE